MLLHAAGSQKAVHLDAIVLTMINDLSGAADD